VDADTSYKIIIGKRTLNRLVAAVSTPHMAMKFLDEMRGIITIKAEPKVARECYGQSLRVAPYSVTKPGKESTSIDLSYPEEKKKLNEQNEGKSPMACPFCEKNPVSQG